MDNYQIGGGNCSLCGSPGTNKSTCPANPAASNPNYNKHYGHKLPVVAEESARRSAAQSADKAIKQSADRVAKQSADRVAKLLQQLADKAIKQEADKAISLLPDRLAKQRQQSADRLAKPHGASLTLLTANIEELHTAGANHTLGLLHDTLNQSSADVITLQEDFENNNKTLTKYDRVSTCSTHFGWSSILQNNIYIKKGIQLNSYDNGDLPVGHAQLRCWSSATVKGVKIITFHLSGGRFEDALYKEFLNLRDQQVDTAIAEGADIILGDFNSGPSTMPVNHPVYKNLSNADRETFIQYARSGHKSLISAGYVRLTSDGPDAATDSFGNISDHIYYNPNKLLPTKMEYIRLMPEMSDHNGILATFDIK